MHAAFLLTFPYFIDNNALARFDGPKLDCYCRMPTVFTYGIVVSALSRCFWGLSVSAPVSARSYWFLVGNNVVANVQSHTKRQWPGVILHLGATVAFHQSPFNCRSNFVWLDLFCRRKMPAAAPAAENGAPRTELQELQLKAQQVTDEVSQ